MLSKKKKLFGNNIKPACRYCKFGTKKENVINCPKIGGDVKPYSTCKSYVYSPLKRIPKKDIRIANSDAAKIDF